MLVTLMSLNVGYGSLIEDRLFLFSLGSFKVTWKIQESCPIHQVDHGVRDPDYDHCKRALRPLYHHKIKGNRHLPIFTFDFSGTHPHRVNAPILRLHSDKAREFLSPVTRTYLSQQVGKQSNRVTTHRVMVLLSSG